MTPELWVVKELSGTMFYAHPDRETVESRAREWAEDGIEAEVFAVYRHPKGEA